MLEVRLPRGDDRHPRGLRHRHERQRRRIRGLGRHQWNQIRKGLASLGSISHRDTHLSLSAVDTHRRIVKVRGHLYELLFLTAGIVCHLIAGTCIKHLKALCRCPALRQLIFFSTIQMELLAHVEQPLRLHDSVDSQKQILLSKILQELSLHDITGRQVVSSVDSLIGSTTEKKNNFLSKLQENISWQNFETFENLKRKSFLQCLLYCPCKYS